jgi:hypothetical protein
VLIIKVVLAGTPRGIELCERHCILPEFVWRLQRLPSDDIAFVVELQPNNLKHKEILFTTGEDSITDLHHLDLFSTYEISEGRFFLRPYRQLFLAEKADAQDLIRARCRFGRRS